MSRSIVVLATVGLALLGIVATPQAASAAPFSVDAPPLSTSGSMTLGGGKDAAATVQVGTEADPSASCTIEPGGESWQCPLTLPQGQTDVVITQVAADGSTQRQTVPVRVLGAPTLDGVAATNGLLTGGGFAGAGIEILGLPVAVTCPAVAATGYWSCVLTDVPSGTYAVSVRQTWPGTGEAGGTTAARTVVLDRDPPAAPAIASPAAGQRFAPGPVAFGGSGEDGARVDVLVDGVLGCSSAVTGGAWSCTAEVAEGERRAQALQWDAAGNPGPTTPAIVFTVAATGATAPAPGRPSTPRPTPAPTTAPQSPAETADPVPSPSTEEAPEVVAGGIPFFSPPVGGRSDLPPLQTWPEPTGYGAAIPPITGVIWWLAAAIGAGLLLLVAIPARVLASALRSRAPERDDDAEPLVRPRTAAVLTLAGSVLVAAMAGGIQAEARYLRLALAIGIALVVLNAVGVALSGRLAGRARATLHSVPLLLAAGAVLAVVSRVAGVAPPIILGVVIVATVAGTRRRTVVAAAQVGALTVLGVLGWVAHGILGPATGFGPSLLSETLAALALGGLGSAVALSLPVGRMPGRALWERSPAAWVAVAAPPAVLAGAVFGSAPGFPLPAFLTAALVFAIVALGVLVATRALRPRTA